MPTLFLIVLIDLIGFGLVIPLLPFYAVRFGATAPEVTWLLATYSLMQLVAAPLWGRLSDRLGRRPVLMASMAASALAYLWLGAANALWMLFAARALAGACAGNIAAAQAYIADITKPEERAHGMGMIGHERRGEQPVIVSVVIGQLDELAHRRPLPPLEPGSRVAAPR